MGEQPQEQSRETSRLEALEKALSEEKRRAEEYLTRLKYIQADLENLKKRSERQIEEARRYGNERLILGLLDVVDELELALKSARETEAVEVLVQGVDMTLKKLMSILRSEGVSPIESTGKVFDPTKHNAIARVEKQGIEECIIVEELRRGYMLKEKVVRPSIVKVAVKPSNEQKNGE